MAAAAAAAKLLQSCPTLCDPMDCSLSGSSLHGIFQASALEWIAISFSRGGLPDPGIKPAALALAGRFFTAGPPGKLTFNCNQPPTEVSKYHSFNLL